MLYLSVGKLHGLHDPFCVGQVFQPYKEMKKREKKEKKETKAKKTIKKTVHAHK